MKSVLSVFQSEEDHDSLCRIVEPLKWKVHRSHDVGQAVAVLGAHPVSVVILDQTLPAGSWEEILSAAGSSSFAPKLIVTHCFAAAHKAEESLRRGAFQVLLKPFSRSEVRQVLGFAWEQCKRDAEPRPELRL